MLTFASRFGNHLDLVEEKIADLDAKVEKVYGSTWQGQYNLENQVKVVRQDISQVKTSVTEVIGEVSNVFHNVTQVRTDVAIAINAGNADREQAFYAASAMSAMVGNHADGAEWGPWTKQSNAPDAAAESGASTEITARLEQEYVVTQDAQEAPAANLAS